MKRFSPHFFTRVALPVGLWVCLSPCSSVVAEDVAVVVEIDNMVAPDAKSDDNFGSSVSLDGDRLAIGVPSDVAGGKESGSVYIFERAADNRWLIAGKLIPLDGEHGDRFGSSVSLDGDRVAIGAESDSNNGSYSGSAYIFERNADGSWFQASHFVPLDGQADDEFGDSVSLDGDRVAIGASDADNPGTDSGAAYVFERDTDGAWVQVSKLLPIDGQGKDNFGTSVSLDGDRVAIGADLDDDNGTNSGSAYVLERQQGGTWVQVSKLLALDGQNKDHFGSPVSLDGDRVAIGANFEDDNGSNAGSAYVFEREADGGWVQVTKLTASDGRPNDHFGTSLSLDANQLAIGAEEDDDNGYDSGSIYLFERGVDGGWSQTNKLLPRDGHRGDSFGFPVSLDRGRLAIGAREYDGDGMLDSGSVYIFDSVLVSPRLTLSGTCPGEIELTSTGTTPRSGIRLYRSTAPGTWEFDSPPCEGISLGLDTPELFGRGNTGLDAEHHIVRTVDASQCGTYLQVIDLKTCLTSEVVQVP